MKIIEECTAVAPKIIIHGLSGVGKSSLAAKLKNPLFLDVEGGLSYIKIPKVRVLDDESLTADLAELCQAAKANKRKFDTIVIDSIDWVMSNLEAKASGVIVKDPISGQVKKDMKATLNKANGGYGNGAQYLVNLVRSELIPRLSILNEFGYSICLIAHSAVKTLMDSDGSSVDRVAPKIHDKVMDVFVEWADDVFYLRNDGGERVLVVEGDDRILAKNRQGLSGEVKVADIDINEILKPNMENK